MSQPVIGYFPPCSGAPGHGGLIRSFSDALARRETASLISLSGGDEAPKPPLAVLYVMALIPSVDDVSAVRRQMGRLLASGVPRERIVTLLLCDGIPGGLSAASIERELGPVDSRWPFEAALQMTAENHGRLITAWKPRSRLARAITGFADVVAQRLKNQARSSAPSETLNDHAAETRVIAGLWRRLQDPANSGKLSDAWLSDHIDREIERLLVQGERLEPAGLELLRRRIKDHVLGLGPLETLLVDPALNEIMVNGDDIFIEKNGLVSRHTEKFQNEKQLRIVIDRMVARSGRRVDLSSPMVDVRLPDGSRVNVILPPLSLSGPVVTVRRFRAGFESMEDLIRTGTLTQDDAAFLERAVRARENILIAGNTGSGKTTLLNVLSRFAGPEERIITLEDTAELSLKQAHVVRLETRTRNSEGAGEVRMDDLLVNALRMRPDRLIVGECRGAEVVPMLQAMNTGHDGLMTTVHANSTHDAMSRLESMVSLAVSNWPPAFVREQIAAGLDLVVCLKREGASRALQDMARVEFTNGRIWLHSVRTGAPS